MLCREEELFRCCDFRLLDGLLRALATPSLSVESTLLRRGPSDRYVLVTRVPDEVRAELDAVRLRLSLYASWVESSESTEIRASADMLNCLLGGRITS